MGAQVQGAPRFDCVALHMALIGTGILAYALKALLGLRPDPDNEEQGLDNLDHGEAGYHMDEAGG